MVDVRGTASSGHYSITARPNCSISPARCLFAFSTISLIALGISVGFALIGAWPVLPFTGIELVALFYAFKFVLLHAGDYERLTIHGDKVVVELHESGHDNQVELNSYWAQVVMECMPDGNCRRLALRSHGREIEFGHHLNSEERLLIGRELKSRLDGFRM